MEFYDFPYIGNFIIPTDELICFRGVGIPPTSFILQLLKGLVGMLHMYVQTYVRPIQSYTVCT